MTDKIDMEDFIRQQIQTATEELVQSVIKNDGWIQNLEQRVIQHAQDRITAKFANIESVPSLADTVRHSVRDLIDNGHVPDIAQFVDQTRITQLVDLAVEREICKGIDALTADPVWIAKIETLISQRYVDRLTDWISQIDINSLICQQIDQSMDRWRDRLMENFATHGIKDLAQTTELTVSPERVDVAHRLSANELDIARSAQIQGTLQVKDLVLTGTVNTDNLAWRELSNTIATETLDLITDDWKQQLIQEVLDLAKGQGIQFDQVLIAGTPLIQDHTLNKTVRHSHLESVGTLSTLTVAGAASFTDTVHVKPRRMGINTSDPEMALSVWDEEVAIIAGKLRKDQAYLGTLRLQNLAIGVNRQAYLEVNTEGLTTIKNLRIDRHSVSFGTQVPGYKGTRGDLVFNSDPNEGQPFAWVCLGAYSWQALRAMS